jgi:hypothetical protein
MKKTIFALLATVSVGVSAQTYVGFGVGKSDFTNTTTKDREIDSLTISQNEQKPTAFGIFVGEKLNKNFAYELSYINFGKEKISGSTTSGSDTAKLSLVEKTEGLGLSILANYDIDNFSPYVRLGLMYAHKTSDITKNDPALLFQNPNNESISGSVIRPIYGLGLAYKLDKNFFIRLDHIIIKDAYVDYINNINSGYIKRDASLTTLGVLYQFDGQGKIATTSSGEWSLGVSSGSSRTDARMTRGLYNGNIWDLRTNSNSGTVTGAMSDDKSDTTYKLSLYKDTDRYEYEFFVATLGEFKSKSGTNGVTGVGNAVTGTAQRTANAFGANMGYKLKLNEQLVIIPKVGLALVNTRDEIYNNLDFAGVGGTERGPVVKKSVVTPTIGLSVGYKINKSVELKGGIDYFDKTGSDATLGKGSISTLNFGVKVGI